MSKIIELYLITTDNLNLVELSSLKKGEDGSPAKKGLYHLIKTQRQFETLCIALVKKFTKNQEKPGCMCSLGVLKAASKLTGFKITKNTEILIRNRYKNSTCNGIDGENIIKFLRGQIDY